MYDNIIKELKIEQDFLDNIIKEDDLLKNDFDVYLMQNYFINNGLLIYCLINLNNIINNENIGSSEVLKSKERIIILDELIKFSSCLADIEMNINKYIKNDKINIELINYLNENSYKNYLDKLNDIVELCINNLVN